MGVLAKALQLQGFLRSRAVVGSWISRVGNPLVIPRGYRRPMGSGHIVRRGDAWRVMVYAGRDPVTGRKRQVTQTVRGSKKDAERVRNELLVAVQHGRTGGPAVTFGELLDDWFESASPDWSPRTALEHRRIIDSVPWVPVRPRA